MAVIITCFACPIFQAFDHWDHGEKTGKDTETSLIVVAVSVGLAIPVANLLFKTSTVARARIVSTSLALDASHVTFAVPPVPVSQPPPVLRI